MKAEMAHGAIVDAGGEPPFRPGANVRPSVVRGYPDEFLRVDMGGESFAGTDWSSAVEQARADGKRGIIFGNTLDAASESGRNIPSDVVMVFQGDDIYSAFDPRLPRPDRAQ